MSERSKPLLIKLNSTHLGTMDGRLYWLEPASIGESFKVQKMYKVVGLLDDKSN